VLQAVAARRERGGAGLDPRLLLRLLHHRVFAVAILLNLLGFVLHVAALRTLPLFLAQAVIASSVVVTAVVGARVFDVSPSRAEWAAVGAVCVGIALLTASASYGEKTSPDPALAAALLPVTALVALLGVVAARLPGPLGASVLGLVSGLGFAVVAVAGRVLPDLSPPALATQPAAYALVLAGPVAFLLYAVALQRAAVMTATSSLVLVQTVAPALVGVLVLGDQVRPGGVAFAVCGLVLAVAGAATLARFDPYLLAEAPPAGVTAADGR
jgi:drug/metabolite transporter (DMT)-like permease